MVSTKILRRQTLLWALMLASSMGTQMLMVYQTACILLNTESPMVVVLSGSMEPAFQRGDILFFTNPPAEQYKTGDIIVYRIPGHETPLVHRIVETHDVGDPPAQRLKSKAGFVVDVNTRDQKLLTKGDNNAVDDLGLYGEQLKWLRRRHIIGKVRGFLPYVGYVSIAMNDIRHSGALALAALLSRN